MKGFRDALDHNNLRDISYKGPLFTWNNGRTNGYIEERLDRFVANLEWQDIFRNAVVENIIWDSSDHYPICLSLGGVSSLPKRSLSGRKK